jgi:hypothetical protein
MPGRKPKYREFLITLQEVTGTDNKTLASRIGKRASNVSAYLSGKKKVSKRAIESAMSHFADSWNVMPDKMMMPADQRNTLTTQPGIYFVYDSAGNCVYLGKAANLKTEVCQRLRTKTLRHGIWRDAKLKRKRYKIEEVAAFVTTFVVRSPRTRHNLEALFLCAMINQTQNSNLGHFIN